MPTLIEIVAGAGSVQPRDFTNVNNTVFFIAESDEHDGELVGELWTTDRTTTGTVPVNEIFPGGFSSYLSELANVKGTLFFTAADETSSGELWKSNGSAGGTVLVKDINPGAASSSSSYLTNLGVR